MLSWTVWVPAIALSVIAFIALRRLVTASGFLSPRGAGIAAMQVAVAFALLAGTGRAEEIDCTVGARRCSDCDYISAPPPFAVVWGEECDEGDIWLPAEDFFGNGSESEACDEAEEDCEEWATS